MSNHMGAGNYRAAQLSLRAALVMGLGTVLVTATAVFAGRSVWPRIFTKDSRIVALASSVLVILAVSSVFDGLMSIFRGVLSSSSLHPSSGLTSSRPGTNPQQCLL